jgi:hypothetical protein
MIFDPSMPTSQIQMAVDAIAKQQIPNQFGQQRFALLFLPGTYGTSDTPLNFQVGYYTAVAGLGSSPNDVVINGSIDVYNQCDASQRLRIGMALLASPDCSRAWYTDRIHLAERGNTARAHPRRPRAGHCPHWIPRRRGTVRPPGPDQSIDERY